MADGVDFVLSVMKELSNSEPVMFQRDGSLYVVSAAGFGQVRYGVDTRAEHCWKLTERKPPLSFLKLDVKENKDDPYLKAIAFGPDDNSFCLESIITAGQKLAELPNEGKIYLVTHSSSYHSHKYGYASDGIDVNVSSAEVMDRAEYLELLSDRENEIIRDIDRLNQRSNIYEKYKRLIFPDCLIVTPNLMVSLPRNGKRDLYFSVSDSWTTKTNLLETEDTFTFNRTTLNFKKVDCYSKAPFGVYIKLNAHSVDLEKGKEVVNQTSRELQAVESQMAKAREFVNSLNTLQGRIKERSERLMKEK